MDSAFVLAKNIANTTYEDLPSEVVEVTKKCILDSLGVMIGGSTTDKAAREIVELVREGGGKEESTIIAFGDKVPSWMAAFANGAMMHVLDYEDTHDAAIVHPTACTLPAALAIAERLGKINGKDFITAVVLGSDMAIRLGLARTKPIAWYGWLFPEVHAAFSSTAAAGKLLKLNEDEIVSALGIALNQAAGSMETIFDPGSVIRQIRDCFSQKAGVLSALMAQRGIQGVRNSFEGKGGLFNLYYRGEYNPGLLTSDQGKKFEIVDISFKTWPSCRFTHAYIEAALGIMRENDIKPGDVREIIVAVGAAFNRMLCEPLEERRKPTQSIDAKFSIPFTVAIAVARGNVVISDFLPEGLKNAAVLEMAQKVTCSFDSELDVKGIPPAVVEIRAKNGKTYSKRIDFPYGHPRNPISTEDLIAKFRDCANYSAKPLSKEKVDRAIDLVLNLEQVKDISEVIQLLH